ncbi:MAG: ABC transporter ATP-binding protein [Planctomycetia bacterium]|jgi:ABC-2 type transport system ATP-binding protein
MNATNIADPILSVERLVKRYRSGLFGQEVRALDGVTISVGRGSVFGLLGPNGAGKSTLVKVLLGLVRGHDGEASLFGLPPGDARSRRRVGFLPEAHRMPGYLTGRELLRIYGMMSGCTREEVEARVPALLERVGMTQAADRKVAGYSKGMQQRIGLAQALVHDPELLFLDEPTDGVDPVGRMAIRELVAELKSQGKTIFINSHLLLEVELMCDRIVIMDKGRIVREGSIADLTPRTGVVRFEFAAPVDAQAFAGIGGNLRLDGVAAELHLDEHEVDACVDRLRAHGASIRSMTPRKLSLEESFLGAVQERRP